MAQTKGNRPKLSETHGNNGHGSGTDYASITRRDVLKSIAGMVGASSFPSSFTCPAFGQMKRQLPVRSLSHVTFIVADVKRSVDFYQGLFGMGITSRQGSWPSLQIGSGVEFFFFASDTNAKPGINHFC